MQNRRFYGSSTLIAGVLLTATACVYGSGASRDTRAHDIEGTVHLNVTNRSNSPMEIHAAGGGTSYRLGTVLPGLTGHFLVRPNMIVNGPVEFGARSDPRRLDPFRPISARPWERRGLRAGDDLGVGRRHGATLSPC